MLPPSSLSSSLLTIILLTIILLTIGPSSPSALPYRRLSLTVIPPSPSSPRTRGSSDCARKGQRNGCRVMSRTRKALDPRVRGDDGGACTGAEVAAGWRRVAKRKPPQHWLRGFEIVRRSRSRKEQTPVAFATRVWDEAPGGDLLRGAPSARKARNAQRQTPSQMGRRLRMKPLAVTYSCMGNATLPSAQLRFTSEFGMGSGGTTAL